jgi:hypothetical protein
MAINEKQDLIVNNYTRGQYPVLSEDDARRYIQDELQRIEVFARQAAEASIQVADQAPSNPLKGMVRYAVSPWDPLGNGTTGLMVYNGTAWVGV